MQNDKKIKIIEYFLLLIAVVLLFSMNVTPVFANETSRYRDNPANCGTTANSQMCTNPYDSGSNPLGNVACGWDDVHSALHCYAEPSLTPPGTTTSDTQYDASYGGGYIIDCLYYNGSASAPYCSNSGNYWCNSDSSCHNSPANRLTSCTGGTWATFTCASTTQGTNTGCLSPYYDCYSGSDGNCESIPGNPSYTCNGDSPTLHNYYGSGGCTCACDPGYQDCDSSGADSGNGCEVQTGVTACAGGANNDIGSGCACQCQSGYHDCDSSGPDSGNGCEIHDGGTCGTNAVYNGCSGGSGNCICSTNDYECTGDTGCQSYVGEACTSGGRPGTYSFTIGGSDCATSPGGTKTYTRTCNVTNTQSYFQTGTESAYSTTNPLLWGKQYGTSITSDLIHFGNGTNPDLFVVDNNGLLSVNNGGAIQLPDYNSFSETPAEGMLAYDYTGHALEYYNGTSWTAAGGGGGGTPGGAYNSIQYNATGTFGGFGIWNGTTLDLGSGNITTTGTGTFGSIFSDTGAIASNGAGTLSLTQLKILEGGATPTAHTIFQGGDQSHTDITYTLPAALPGSSGDILSSDVSGTMSWTAPPSAVSAKYVGLTSSDYTGNLSYPSISPTYYGYDAGDRICAAEAGALSGSHLCSASEILYSVAIELSSLPMPTSGAAWVSSGPAKYSPADLPVNDCNGFTSDCTDAGSCTVYLGNFWLFDANGGVGGCGNCGNSLPLACCK